MTPKGVKRLAVSPEFLVEMAKNTEWITVRVKENALPPDAEFVGLEVSMSGPPLCYLRIASAEYPPGYATPLIGDMPIWEKRYEGGG